MIEGMKSIEELKAEFEELENEENEIDKMLLEVHETKERFRRFINSCGENDKLIVHLNFA